MAETLMPPASSDCACLNPRGDWDRLAVYEFLDLVTHDGSSWVALVSNVGAEPTFFATAWMVLAEKGDPFEFNLRGPWQKTVVYERFDVVSFSGSSWVARRENIGSQPAESLDWMLLAERGPGGFGTPGPPGPPGPGGEHPGLAVHDALGLATDTELAAHAAATEAHHPINLFIQPTAPAPTAVTYLWIQTGLGLSGIDMTFWVEDNIP